MSFYINNLHLDFKKQKEVLEFKDFNYFYGQMGAGKSTIARLIDYCLGGKLTDKEMTPALQSEFVSASLDLKIGESQLFLKRESGSNQVRASWNIEDSLYEVMIPARVSDGEVVEGTGIEVLSDLFFYLLGVTPPKVRKSKVTDDSELSRLSLRDLLWYCYLDQDSMDSSFFHLERDGEFPKRLKSRDVLRFIIGFYQEKVTELEVSLESCRKNRLSSEAGAAAIKNALKDMEISTIADLNAHKEKLQKCIEAVDQLIIEARKAVDEYKPHGIERLRDRARILSSSISDIELSLTEIGESVSKDRTHRNELLSLSSRFRRSQSAREVLGGVKFVDCPSCGLDLPERADQVCLVCGQNHSDSPSGNVDEAAAERDLDLRVAELTELIGAKEKAQIVLERTLLLTSEKRRAADKELNIVSQNYDSAYLSNALENEKERASLVQELRDLGRIEAMMDKIGELTEDATSLFAIEQSIKENLLEARKKAEKDTRNLDRLKVLFLDCLTRAKISGFWPDDIVNIQAPYFLPEISSKGIGDLAVSSFNNLGSGGKKTLFKCCFAIAVHRLATEIGALLPSFIIIDSPMKNISERENRAQFEGFFSLLYELAENELKGTQIILIDKEVCIPPDDFYPSYVERHMRPNDRDVPVMNNPYPPLIRYYQGK